MLGMVTLWSGLLSCNSKIWCVLLPLYYSNVPPFAVINILAVKTLDEFIFISNVQESLRDKLVHVCCTSYKQLFRHHPLLFSFFVLKSIRNYTKLDREIDKVLCLEDVPILENSLTLTKIQDFSLAVVYWKIIQACDNTPNDKRFCFLLLLLPWDLFLLIHAFYLFNIFLQTFAVPMQIYADYVTCLNI